MEKNIKEKWVKALRSGKYKQAKGVLKNNHGFCCLGVLCDISGMGEWVEVSNSETRFVSTNDPHDFGISLLPTVVHNATEIGDTYILTTMNDKEGKTFDEIADYIEREL